MFDNVFHFCAFRVVSFNNFLPAIMLPLRNLVHDRARKLMLYSAAVEIKRKELKYKTIDASDSTEQ